MTKDEAIKLVKRYADAVEKSVKASNGWTRFGAVKAYADELKVGAMLASQLCGEHVTTTEIE